MQACHLRRAVGNQGDMPVTKMCTGGKMPSSCKSWLTECCVCTRCCLKTQGISSSTWLRGFLSAFFLEACLAAVSFDSNFMALPCAGWRLPARCRFGRREFGRATSGRSSGRCRVRRVLTPQARLGILTLVGLAGLFTFADWFP